MKYTLITLIAAFATLLFAGCDMTEDERNCPTTENVKLTFSLLAKDGKEVFGDNIDKTDLMLFKSGDFHSHQNISTASLGPNRELVLTLDPGTYTVVSWGNVGRKTTMTDPGTISTAADGTVKYNCTDTGCDPLYYAPAASLGLTRSFNPNNELYQFTVPENGNVDETIRFTHAHNKLDVYVKGFAAGAKLPIIEIENASEGFDFYLNNLPGVATISQQSANKTTDEGIMANAVFSIARIKENNGVKIHITDPDTGVREWSADLKDIIESFDDFELEVEIRIPILFEYFNGRFTVKMPDWEKQGTVPGLD